MKKSEIALNTIIGAAIALIVLVVIILIFSGKFQIFGKSISDCQEKGGTCVSTTENCLQNNGIIKKYTNCEQENKICCLMLEPKTTT